jgi:hypothetical protein
MYETYGDLVKFVLVYVREAHPNDSGRPAARPNTLEGIDIETATSFAQKEEYGALCVRKLDIHFTTVIDGMDAQVEQDYTALPDRMYLVDKAGKIAYKSDPGPHGFLPEDLEPAIKKELAL